jgi:asparagine synthase (glutamine-hydrolysing)
MGKIIAVMNRKDINAKQTAVSMLEAARYKGAEAFGLASPTKVISGESIEALNRLSIASPVIVGGGFSKIITTDTPLLTKFGRSALTFEGRIYAAGKTLPPQDIIEKLQSPDEKSVETFIENADGDFAFAIAQSGRLIAGRDTVGVQPLYYGEKDDVVGLASERKALWKIGIETVSSFPPGNMAIMDKHSFCFKPVKTLSYSKARRITMQDAAEQLLALLKKSVKRRVLGLKEVAVAFSGGLDSSVVAFLAKNSGVNVHLMHVSLKGMPELEHAKTAARSLGLPVHMHLYGEKDVEKVFPKVLRAIEERNPTNASIGIPIYWVAEKTAEMNIRVLLAGQGADELFGGYKRYVEEYARQGAEKVRHEMFKDVSSMHEINLERDLKICSSLNIELRLPFATHEIAQFATQLPMKLRIKPPPQEMRKLVLVKVAQKLGLPPQIASRPKKAIQYTTGVNKTLKKLANKEGLSLRQYAEKEFRRVAGEMMFHD